MPVSAEKFFAADHCKKYRCRNHNQYHEKPCRFRLQQNQARGRTNDAEDSKPLDQQVNGFLPARSTQTVQGCPVNRRIAGEPEDQACPDIHFQNRASGHPAGHQQGGCCGNEHQCAVFYFPRIIRIFQEPAVLCQPARHLIGPVKKGVDSAKHAGAREVFLVAEPMAAAIGVGLPVDQPSGNMIIDIGGGTTEIAVIALNGIVCDTSIRVGGDELDEAIVSYIKKNHNLLIGDQTAENIKKTIGSAYKFDEEREMEVKGLYQVSGVPKTLKISSVEIREALMEPIQAICDALKQSLEQTPPELAADIKDRGIVLTGGGALIKGLPELLREQTDLPINLMDDPLFCVVLGTGKILDDFDRYRPVIMQSGRN